MNKIIGLVVVLLLTACSKDNSSNVSPQGPVSLQEAGIASLISGDGNFGTLLPPASKLVTFNIKNSGDATIVASAISSNPDFIIAYQAPACANLGANKSCQIKVSFSSAGKAFQLHEGTLTYDTLTIPLSVSVENPTPPVADVTYLSASEVITSLEFGNITDKQSVIKTLSIKNSGTAVINSLVTLNNTNYTIVFDSCSGKNIAKNNSCSVKISLSGAGKDGDITSILTYAEVDLPLNGHVTGPAPINTSPNFVFIRSNLEITNLAIGPLTGTQSVTEVITIKNIGTAPNLVADTAMLSSSDFAFIQNLCSSKILAPNQSCQVRVSFSASGKTNPSYMTNLSFSGASLPITATLIPPLTVSPLNLSLIDSGSIHAISVSGGQPPYTYSVTSTLGSMFENAILTAGLNPSTSSIAEKARVTDASGQYKEINFRVLPLPLSTNPVIDSLAFAIGQVSSEGSYFLRTENNISLTFNMSNSVAGNITVKAGSSCGLNDYASLSTDGLIGSKSLTINNLQQNTLNQVFLLVTTDVSVDSNCLDISFNHCDIASDKHFYEGLCEDNVRTCSGSELAAIPNSVSGTVTWEGTTYSVCNVDACEPHYDLINNNCNLTNYNLSVSKTLGGSISGGSLICSSGDLSCSSQESALSEINLQAIVEPGYEFVSWGGDASICGSNINCSIIMDANKNISASFNAISYQLTITPPTAGSINILSSSNSPLSPGFYPPDTVITLEYTPSVNQFIAWSNCEGEVANPQRCSLTLNQNTTVSGSVYEAKFNLTSNPSSSGYYALKSSDNNLSCFSSENCSNLTAAPGQTTQLSKIANGDTAVSSWSLDSLLGGGSCVGSPCAIQYSSAGADYNPIKTLTMPESSMKFNRYLPTGYSPGIVTKIVNHTDGFIYQLGAGNYMQASNATRVSKYNPTTNAAQTLFFNCQLSGNHEYNDMVVQPDGKIIVVGSFSMTQGACSGTGQTNAYRINTDGSLDTSFLARGYQGSSGDGKIYKILRLSNGDYILTGNFNGYRETPTGSWISAFGMVRINSSNTVQYVYPFNSGAIIYGVEEADDGSLIVAGQFTTYNSVANANLVRINVNGTVHPQNPSVKPAFSSNYSVAIDRASDQYYLIAASIQYKYNNDGTKVSGFSEFPNDYVNFPNAKFINGNLYVVGNRSASGFHHIIGKINTTTGQWDATFKSNMQIATEANVAAATIPRGYDLIEYNGDLLLAGAFVALRGVPVGNYVAITSEGKLSGQMPAPSVQRGFKSLNNVNSLNPVMDAVQVTALEGNNLWMGQTFPLSYTHFDTTPIFGFALLDLATGKMNSSFNPQTQIMRNSSNSIIGPKAIIPLSNNKRVIINEAGNGINSFNGTTFTDTPAIRISSANAYEARMSTFIETYQSYLYDGDDKVLLAVNASLFNCGGSCRGGNIVQKLDTTLTPMTTSTFAPSNINFFCSTQNFAQAKGILKLTVGAQAGKYLVYGNFCAINVAGTVQNGYKYIARLNANGTLDTTFQTNFSAILFGGSTAGDFSSAVELSNGDILVSGMFHTINSNSAIRGIARLNGTNGTLITSGHGIPYDALFRPAAASQANPDWVTTLYKDSAGRIYLIGNMKRDQANPLKLVRLTSSLAIDSSFPTTSVTGVVTLVSGVLEVGSYLYVWGRFDSFNGIPVHNFIRVNANTGTLAE